MSNSKVSFVGYHGTDVTSVFSILKSKSYRPSINYDRHWLGSGIYFFVDTKQDKAKGNAVKWCISIKRFKKFGVLETTVAIDVQRIANLNDAEWQNRFEETRSFIAKQIIDKGLTLKVSDSLRFDSMVIDEMCEASNIDAIIQQRYVNFDKFLYKDVILAPSYIPNCLMMCVKDHNVIDINSIKRVL